MRNLRGPIRGRRFVRYFLFIVRLMIIPVRQAMIDEFDKDREINEQEFFCHHGRTVHSCFV